MISFAEAVRIVEREYASLPHRIVNVPLTDAVGRTFVEDVVTDTPLPPFTNAAVDGIAIRFAEDRTTWSIIAEITAGHFREILLREDEGIKIMTGAKLPENVDTVIPVEDIVTQRTHVRLRPGAVYRKGMNTRLRCEDMEKGAIAVRAGDAITSSVIPLLAACGKETVTVHAPWTAAIVTTGDELIPHGSLPVADKIRATNRPMLIAVVAQAGITPADYGIVNDDHGAITDVLSALLKNNTDDFIITTGGISVGTRDLLRSVLHDLGAEELFWRVNMKPGKPVMFSRWNSGSRKKLIVSLPGNPLSAFVTWRTLFAPIFATSVPNAVTAIFTSSYSKKDAKKHFVCGCWEHDTMTGMPAVRLAGSQSSGGMSTLARTQCLIIIPEDIRELPTGAHVQCIPL